MTTKFNTIAAIILAVISMAIPSTSQAQVGLQTDLNHDSTVNISDVSYLISLLMGRATDDAVAAGICPNAMHPHVIDLGLPSGTKWTCCNIGAATPLEYGDYYSWGEMSTKTDYSQNKYCYYDSGSDSYFSLGNDIAGTNYDVATIKWGEEYAMPTRNQIKELVDNCTSKWTTIGGVKGRVFQSTNGNKIFLPAAGYRDVILFDGGSLGNYWSSTQYTYDHSAYYLTFSSSEKDVDDDSRHYGDSVRPVAR